MRLLLACITILYSVSATAETYRVWQYTDNVRVVLTETACKSAKAGLQARAERDDGATIIGCYVPEGKNMVRITWENKDFAILELTNFNPISSTLYKMMNKDTH